MSLPPGLLQWTHEVSTHLPHLSHPQAVVLAWWSYGIATTRCCGLTTVATFLALLRSERANTVRQRLREWCYDAQDKSGRQRQAVPVGTCFAPLLGWIVAWWSPAIPRLALALDATTLGQAFTVLAVCVVYNRCSIPVAWVVLRGDQAGSWRPHWEGLLARIAPAIPAHWQVVVSADSGLYAKWLYQAISAYGWHPYLRLSGQGYFRSAAGQRWRPLVDAARRGGALRRWDAVCFKTQACQLRCTLLAWWAADQAVPWLILTDLAPRQAQLAWYGLRAWIETGFKYTKRGGWHWEQSKMRDPQRVERLWLAMAVATLRVVSLEPALPSSLLPALPTSLSVFRRGWLYHLVLQIKQQPLPVGRFIPSPWPDDRLLTLLC